MLTQVIQVPQGKYRVLPTERTKVSSYPVALIPGQFQEYYKRYAVLTLTFVLAVAEGRQSLAWGPWQGLRSACSAQDVVWALGPSLSLVGLGRPLPACSKWGPALCVPWRLRECRHRPSPVGPESA